MALALRTHAIVDADHGVTLHAAELKPGAKVEVIVLAEAGNEDKQGASFLDAIAGLSIDAPADFSTTFDRDLYANRGT